MVAWNQLWYSALLVTWHGQEQWRTLVQREQVRTWIQQAAWYRPFNILQVQVKARWVMVEFECSPLMAPATVINQIKNHTQQAWQKQVSHCGHPLWDQDILVKTLGHLDIDLMDDFIWRHVHQLSATDTK